MNTGDYIYKGIFARLQLIRPILASVHCKNDIWHELLPCPHNFLKHRSQGIFIRCIFDTHQAVFE